MSGERFAWLAVAIFGQLALLNWRAGERFIAVVDGCVAVVALCVAVGWLR